MMMDTVKRKERILAGEEPDPNVDLKWSLWSAFKETWDVKDAPDVWDAMEAAFNGDRPEFTVYTAPRKEIRYGTVNVSKGRAYIDFRAIWDSPACHIPEHVSDDDTEDAIDTIADYFAGQEGYEDGDPESPIGARVVQTLKARPRESFKAFMGRIDKCEDELIKQEHEHSEEFNKWLETMFPEEK